MGRPLKDDHTHFCMPEPQGNVSQFCRFCMETTVPPSYAP